MAWVLSQLILCLSILAMALADCSNEMWNEPKKECHPCARPCTGDDPLICYYEFDIELYYAMSKACYDCPANISDCYREDCIPGDGFGRVVITANRQMPGPAIEVCHGDKIFVRLNNKMNGEATSIHWHGMLQHGTPYMDGVPMITQCPIAPGTTFDYIYYANDPGTHFWHGHVGTQRMDGLFGAIIVRQPDYESIHNDLYDEDIHTIVINDWSHSNGDEALLSFLQRGGPNAGNIILINGRGRYYNDTLQVTYTPVQVFHVEKGKRYRFRVIDASSFACPKVITFDNHTMLAVATDGWDFEPRPIDSVVMNPGERYDFIIHANQTSSNYWIRVVGVLACEATKSHTVAILHYDDADCTEPTLAVGYSLQPPSQMMLNPINSGRNATGVIEIPDLNAPYYNSEKDTILLSGVPQKRIYLSFDFKKIDNPWFHRRGFYGYNQVNESMKAFTPQFNNRSFRTPNVPPLSQYCELNSSLLCNSQRDVNCTENYCECIMMYELEVNDVVELILINEGYAIDANHPFHLHGYAFRVMAMDKLGTNITTNDVRNLVNNGKILYNFENPPYKDTVSVPDGGYMVLRFVATNPGCWFFHCHFEFHLEMKMAVFFRVGEFNEFPPVPKGFPKCGIVHDGDYSSCGQQITDYSCLNSSYLLENTY